jgi:hypothetical protein
MSYKLSEVRVTLPNGTVVTAEVSNIDDIKELLSNLGQFGLSPTHLKTNDLLEKPTKVEDSDIDSPEARVETRADLAGGSLRAKSVLAFKDGVPQLLRPNAFGSVADASVALLFAVEVGLKKNSLEFDAFKGLYESQNIKSGSPVSMLLTNLRNAKYLDSKLYSAERKVRLTAKGEAKAIEVLKALAATSK